MGSSSYLNVGKNLGNLRCRKDEDGGGLEPLEDVDRNNSGSGASEKGSKKSSKGNGCDGI